MTTDAEQLAATLKMANQMNALAEIIAKKVFELLWPLIQEQSTNTEKLARIADLVYSDLRWVGTDVLQNIIEDTQPCKKVNP